MEFPTAAPITAADGLDVAQLVSYLRSSSRTRPVIVLTVARGTVGPQVDATGLDHEFGRQVDIITLPTEVITFALSDSVGRQASVFGGACRVYPPGDAWEQRPHLAPLRLARTPKERSALHGNLLRDIRAALAAGKASRPAAPGTPVARPAPRNASPAQLAQPRPGGTTGLESTAEVATAQEADRLAAYLLTASRGRPVVVVTRATGRTVAYAAVDELREALTGLADLVEITTAKASWAFSETVPDGCQVYGGAGRVYPIGNEWLDDPYLSPLRFAYSVTDRTEITRLLRSDAMSMSARVEHSRPAAAEQPRPVEGQVSGIAADRAIVQLDGSGLGVVWPEFVLPGQAAERLFTKGMHIRGIQDPHSRRIDVSGMRRTSDEALTCYTPGDTILARVTRVETTGCTVELFPGVSQEVASDDLVRDGADVRLLMVEGDVLRFWFADRDGDEWVLSLLDAGPAEEVVPAPSILAGGPPWIAQPTTADQQERAGGQQGEDDELSFEVSGDEATDLIKVLRRESAQKSVALSERDARIAALEKQLAGSRAKLRDAERRANSRWALSSRDLFETEEEQLDFEIRSAWALTTTASEKRDLPLKNWSYGPEFFSSLAKVQGIKRDKVIEVLVHVLTGRDTELTSRERHQLRTGPGGDDTAVVRKGGENCWRVSLQVRTPSARRLHYWQRNDGGIELSSIRVHDDFRP